MILIEKSVGSVVAIKIIDKLQPLHDDSMSQIKNEIAIIKTLKHKGIIALKDVIDTNDKIYVVLEYVNGGELLERKRLNEECAKKLFINLLDAVRYLHGKKIVHRDLKLDNILMASTDPTDFSIKIIDFGIANKVKPGYALTLLCGSQGYLAPEILSEKRKEDGYSFPVDMWALGVILFAVLSGSMPFNENENFENYNNIISKFTDPEWESVSESAKDMVKNLLLKNEEERITAKQAMEHKWISAS